MSSGLAALPVFAFLNCEIHFGYCFLYLLLFSSLCITLVCTTPIDQASPILRILALLCSASQTIDAFKLPAKRRQPNPFMCIFSSEMPLLIAFSQATVLLHSWFFLRWFKLWFVQGSPLFSSTHHRKIILDIWKLISGKITEIFAYISII